MQTPLMLDCACVAQHQQQNDKVRSLCQTHQAGLCGHCLVCKERQCIVQEDIDSVLIISSDDDLAAPKLGRTQSCCLTQRRKPILIELQLTPRLGHLHSSPEAKARRVRSPRGTRVRSSKMRMRSPTSSNTPQIRHGLLGAAPARRNKSRSIPTLALRAMQIWLESKYSLTSSLQQLGKLTLSVQPDIASNPILCQHTLL